MDSQSSVGRQVDRVFIIRQKKSLLRLRLLSSNFFNGFIPPNIITIRTKDANVSLHIQESLFKGHRSIRMEASIVIGPDKYII
jgi:hypothetical protein